MAIHKVLCSKYRTSTIGEFAQVGTSHNGKFSPIGTGLPTSVESNGDTSAGRLNCKNRVIEFENELYCVQRSDIYKYNASINEWELDHAAGAKHNDADGWGDVYSLGLYIAPENGINYLYHVWGTAYTTSFRSVRKQSAFTGSGVYETEQTHSTPFGAYNSAAAGNTSLEFGGFLDVVEFNSKIYSVCTFAVTATAETLASIFTYDFTTQTMGGVLFPAVSVSGADIWGNSIGFAGYNNRLFFLAAQGHSSSDVIFIEDGYVVVEIVGGVGVTRLEIATGNGDNTVDTRASCSSKPIMFSDGDYLYAGPITSDTISAGYKLHQIETSGQALVDLGEITQTVLPDSIGRGSQRTDPNAVKAGGLINRATMYTQVDASGNDEIIMMHTHRSEPGVPASFWKWNGPSQQMSYLGRGHGAEVAMPSMRQGGGSYLWSNLKPFQAQIEKVEPSPVPGNIRLSYRLVGGSGEPVVARFLFDKQLEQAKTFASLQSVTSPAISSGVAVSGSYVTGIVADQNILYEIDWKAEQDGIAVGDNYVINTVAFVGPLIP